METALTGLIVLTVLLLAVLTIGQTYLATQDAVMESWRGMEERLGERARTDLTPVSAETTGDGTIVRLTLSNGGDTKVADFDRWDVIVQYHQVDGGYAQEWLRYDEFGGANRWTVNYDEGTMAVFEPRVFNSGEQMVIQLTLDPAVAMTSTNLVTVAAPNGISASTVFTR
jgi:hypothetical protein